MKILLYILILIPISAVTQNLVMNGSVEEMTLNCVHKMNNGGNIYAKNIYYFKGTPDILNTCALSSWSINFVNQVGIPKNYAGYQWPRTGNGMISYLHSYSIPNCFSCALGIEIPTFTIKKKLTIGKKYYFRLFLVLSDSVKYATDLVEAAFSSDSVMIIADSINYYLLISNSGSGKFFSDTLNWMELSGTITATGKEKYIQIGRLHKLKTSNVITLPISNFTQLHYIYSDIILFYLDDVALWPCDTTPPVADAGPDITICRGDSVLIGEHDYDDYYYSWWHDSICYQNGPTEIYRDDSLGKIFVKPKKSTLYIVQATDFKYDKTIDSVWVFVKDCSPALADTTICLGESIHLGSDNFQYESYLWSPDIWLDNALSASPLASPNGNISYTVAATDTNGSIHFDTVNIKVKICHLPPEIIIPNVITPNGDGTNDIFRFENEQYWHLKVKIFNRWGQLLFTGDENRHWDGTFKGQKVSDGVYFYVIEARAQGFEKVTEYRGSVTVFGEH